MSKLNSAATTATATATAPKAAKKKAPQRVGDSKPAIEAAELSAAEVAEQAIAAQAKARARAKAYHEARRKLSVGKQLAVSVRKAISNMESLTAKVERWGDGENVAAIRKTLASAANELSDAANQLDGLPDDFPPKAARAKKAKGKVDESAIGSSVCVREKYLPIYEGNISTSDVLVIKGYRQGFVTVEKDGAQMFIPRGHLQISATPAG